ncbi:ATP-binding protein [Streptomyces sp. BK340]|uniref:ATP-binding protein n=1 Tax=Streptomyces sp. BK340 TaxID=2572903 RepID=UPI0011AD9D0D|nr:ATP-binding protein [Streptomyces sp. BK340]TVZ84758.1 histidine kinase-like protein [Streptomyces sp. BK340]
MTTTAVWARYAGLRRDGDLMDERIRVAPRRGDGPPREEDAWRIGTMRRIAAAKLRFGGCEALIDAAMLIVSELLTNALLHSGTQEIRLRLILQGGSLRIVVDDGRPATIEPHNADDDAETGRGLTLVAALVKENGGTWGGTDQGTGVWCELRREAKSQ